jgi:acetyl esterase/lipase
VPLKGEDLKPRTMCHVLAVLLAASTPLWSQNKTIDLWPDGNPQPTSFDKPEYDPTTDADRLKAGKVTLRLTNVSRPTISVYFPKVGQNARVGVLVFPGGGYDHLAWNIEGTEACEWLQSIGVTCAAVKYRVPEKGGFPENPADLEDVQQAVRIFRSHASEWHVDPARIGVVGFSAGGNLAALLSRNFAYQGNKVPPSNLSARPDFQILLYPGGLTERGGSITVAEAVKPNKDVPPTLIVQAINDPASHVESTLAYFIALKNEGVTSELHLFAEGGHGFGLRPTELPITHWTALAERWLITIKVLQDSSVKKS